MLEVKDAGGAMPPAQMIEECGFMADEVSAPTITAYLAAWHDTPSGDYKRGTFQQGVYGVAWAGRGGQGLKFGYGISYGQIPMLACGGLRLLKDFPDATIQIHAIKELSDYVGPGGHAREARKRGGFKADGKTPLVAFDLMEPLMVAMDSGRLLVRILDKSSSRPPAYFAKGRACYLAKEALRRFKAHTPWPFPNNPPKYHLLGEG